MKLNYCVITDYFTEVPYIYQVDVAKEMGISAVQLNNYVKDKYLSDHDFVRRFNRAVKVVAKNGRIKPMYIAQEMGAFRSEVSAWINGNRKIPAKHKKSYDSAVNKIRAIVSSYEVMEQCN